MTIMTRSRFIVSSFVLFYTLSGVIGVTGETRFPPSISDLNVDRYGAGAELRLTDANNVIGLWGEYHYSRVIIDVKNNDAGTVGLYQGTILYIDEMVFINGGFFEWFGFKFPEYNIFLKKSGQHTLDVIRRMRYRDPSGNLFGVSIIGETSDYYSLWGNGVPWTRPPVPEPATYGAVFAACGLGFALYRGRKRTGRRGLPFLS